MKNNKKIIIMILMVVIFILLDQTLKIYCMNNKITQKILPGISLTYEESQKGEWGIGENGIITYVISTIVVLGVILKFFFNQIERINIGTVIGISLILAGGIGNLIDKLFHGFVINCIQLFNIPTVNFSFIIIALGWIELAAIFAFNTWKEMRKNDA